MTSCQPVRASRRIIDDYFPGIVSDDIRASIEFAKNLVENEDIHVIEEAGVL